MTAKQTTKKYLSDMWEHIREFFDLTRRRNVLVLSLIIISFVAGSIIF
jgi:hypothetical protein